MIRSKHSTKATKAIIKLLDSLARKHGLGVVRHASNKWCNAQRAKISLAKARKALEEKLIEINRKLAR